MYIIFINIPCNQKLKTNIIDKKSINQTVFNKIIKHFKKLKQLFQVCLIIVLKVLNIYQICQ